MPKLKEDLFAVPDGAIHPKWFLSGEDVTGQVAEAAKAQHKLEAGASKKASQKTKSMKAPENK